ncbi:hypothetical protein HaLaN_18449 [Haematococcus lacustris]|uniref:Uncharacterized protein n=1 Tax=Haematococcus lacustris TaxID=44745 RepID=A0A699ZQW4_HAELA|nr:hypothetical protein HaLaN_18449 [Haematococcus lacustris]
MLPHAVPVAALAGPHVFSCELGPAAGCTHRVGGVADAQRICAPSLPRPSRPPAGSGLAKQVELDGRLGGPSVVGGSRVGRCMVREGQGRAAGCGQDWWQADWLQGFRLGKAGQWAHCPTCLSMAQDIRSPFSSLAALRPGVPGIVRQQCSRESKRHTQIAWDVNSIHTIYSPSCVGLTGLPVLKQALPAGLMRQVRTSTDSRRAPGKGVCPSSGADQLAESSQRCKWVSGLLGGLPGWMLVLVLLRAAEPSRDRVKAAEHGAPEGIRPG